MTARSEDIVFTGGGMCCHLGDDVATVAEMLRTGRGKPFTIWDQAVEFDGRCQLIGQVTADLSNQALGVSAAQGRFMGRSARMALLAARHAIAEARCETRNMAVFVGSGVGDCDAMDETRAKLESTKSMRKVSPASVPKLMASTISANLSTVLEATGPSCSLTAACATGPYNIVMAALLLQTGAADIALAGGSDAIHLSFFAGFDSMRAFNGVDNERPEIASRPYAADREGFILSEGAGIVVLETRRHAEARGANILGVLRGFGMSSDGTGQMVAPAPDGGLRAMQAALRQSGVQASEVEYVNTHGTSTPLGDISEVKAMRQLFGERRVPYSSIKGYVGHSVSAAGAIEAVFTLQMMKNKWLAPCINIGTLDPELTDYPPILEPINADVKLSLSNSFGFGGTNVSLLLAAED
ncbi:MAG: 3-oxoacyl-[acyl-carrier-protein] synthase [Pseudomonadota bacterium]|jgi:3-oxoacyl-[acyl-carrier-protein] synthase-1